MLRMLILLKKGALLTQQTSYMEVATSARQVIDSILFLVLSMDIAQRKTAQKVVSLVTTQPLAIPARPPSIFQVENA